MGAGRMDAGRVHGCTASQGMRSERGCIFGVSGAGGLRDLGCSDSLVRGSLALAGLLLSTSRPAEPVLL